MLVCSDCLKNEAVWSDGSTKYVWCDDCVPRGCSCNEESFCKITKEYQEQYDCLTYEESIEDIKLRINKHPNNIQILYSKSGVKFSDDIGTFVIHSDKCNYEVIDNSLLFDNEFVSNLLSSEESSIKVKYIDDEGRESPCAEIMYLDDDMIKREGDLFYSLLHNTYITIGEIYHNKSFVAYPTSFFKDGKSNVDYSNPLFYPREGIIFDSELIDIVINKYEAEDLEFLLLKDLIFSTSCSSIFNEYNNDLSSYFTEYSLESRTEDELFAQDIVKVKLIEMFSKTLKINPETQIKLFELLVKFHKINDILKYDDTFEHSSNMIINRKDIFNDIFQIIYNNIIKVDIE